MVLKQAYVIILWFLSAGYALAANGDTSATANPVSTPLPPAYPSKPGACHVLLKPIEQHPLYVRSSDAPACRAFLDNFNKFCDEPPQYERRKLHSTTSNLSEPQWKALDPKENLDLIKLTYSPYATSENLDAWWDKNKNRVQEMADTREIRLQRSVVKGADLRGGTHTVYMLENLNPNALPGSNQPHLMITEVSQRIPSPLFKYVFTLVNSDLWGFGRRWFLMDYSPFDKWFSVRELSRPTEEPVGAPTICAIQHINDRQGGK